MLLKSIVKLSLFGAVLAQPLQHQHHQHKQDKRGVKIITRTSVVYAHVAPTPLNGETSVVYAHVAPTSLNDETIYYSQTQVHTQNQPAETVVSTQHSQEPVTTATPNFNVGAKGITYSPYSDNGGCKPASQISSEIKSLSGFEIIRLYGVDCDQVNVVLSSLAPSQKLLAGIFDVTNIESAISTLAAAVNANGGWSKIYTVSVGNELVNAGSASVAQISQYVQTARAALTNVGYNGPVVSVDTFIAVINNPGLCDISDYIAVNAHAFFDGHIKAENSGDWVTQQIQRIKDTCKNQKQVLITETGWPSRGDTNGVAVPSDANQAAAIASIKNKCGSDVILFTAFDDLWKASGPFNAEQFWGVF